MELLEILHRVDTALIGVTTPRSRGIIEVLAGWSSDLSSGGTVSGGRASGRFRHITDLTEFAKCGEIVT